MAIDNNHMSKVERGVALDPLVAEGREAKVGVSKGVRPVALLGEREKAIKPADNITKS